MSLVFLRRILKIVSATIKEEMSGIQEMVHDLEELIITNQCYINELIRLSVKRNYIRNYISGFGDDGSVLSI